MQWGIGLLIDGFRRAGLDEGGVFPCARWPCSWPAALCRMAYFLLARDNHTGSMNAILIIAHAPLAHALRQCALHVFPDCGALVAAIDVQPNLSPEETLATARSRWSS